MIQEALYEKQFSAVAEYWTQCQAGIDGREVTPQVIGCDRRFQAVMAWMAATSDLSRYADQSRSAAR